MKKLFRFILLQVHGLFPFLYPMRCIFQDLNFFRGIHTFRKNAREYRRKQNVERTPFPIQAINFYPMYFARYQNAGDIPKHYFYQDLCGKEDLRNKVTTHHDVGSGLDGFISHCLVFTKVVMLDEMRCSVGQAREDGVSEMRSIADAMQSLPAAKHSFAMGAGLSDAGAEGLRSLTVRWLNASLHLPEP